MSFFVFSFSVALKDILTTYILILHTIFIQVWAMNSIGSFYRDLAP